VNGFNYLRRRAAEGKAGGDHATFDADTERSKAHYDPKQAEAIFRTISQAGYNTVRVFIIGRSTVNPGVAGDYDEKKALYEPYRENVLDFLRRATRYGIRVFPTLLGLQCQNEAYLRANQWPFGVG